MKNREIRFYNINDLTKKTKYEVALLGRSNVGKSSLLNLLTDSKIAKVSQRPGSTLWIGSHDLGNKQIFDLPGYGYTTANEMTRDFVNTLAIEYFKLKRTDLVLMLIDSRHGLKRIDLEIQYFISQYCHNIKLVGTKFDKKDSKNINFDFATSAQSRYGVEELKAYIKNI